MRSACAPGAPPLAYSACVRLARLNELWGGDEPGFLSQTEWARWSGFPSDKRRLEFAAGRLAAKLVAHATRRSLGWRPLPLRELQVRPDSGGQPWLSAPDAPPLRLAISHAAGVAYAACSPEPVWLGLDVVDRARWLPFDPPSSIRWRRMDTTSGSTAASVLR